MDNSFIKTLLIAAVALCPFVSFGQCETLLKDFYISYMQNAERNDKANTELLARHMAPETIERLRKYTEQTDADAVIHAQDVCEYARESLTVTPGEEEGWYIVRYRWSPESDETLIPVNAVEQNGQLTILEISPSNQ